MHPLFNYFLYQGIPEADAERIAEAFQFKSFAKGDFFVEEGKTSRWLAFVTKGWFQYFYLKDGQELTTYISGENNFLASVGSFFKQQPSKEFIRALDESEAWLLHFNDLQKLKAESEAFKTFYIGAMEGVLIGMDETRTNLIILTAEERYAVLLQQEPALLQQIPLQYLASILGVTPRHLSRIRNNIR